MDFLDPKKKRAHAIRLYVGYVVIGVLIGITTLVLLFQSNGYDLDRKTGQIIQKGIVFVNAHPEKADIYLNNKLYKTHDNARMYLPTGDYTLTLKREGYRNWQRHFILEGRSIERLVYPFMFPSKLDTVDRQTYSTAPAFATQSPDRRWILVQQPGQTNVFDIIDANDPAKPATSLTVPVALLGSADQQSWKLTEWSSDSRHVLLQHFYGNQNEFVMVDRADPEKSVNLNHVFKRNPTKVSLRDKKFDRLYLYDATSAQLEYGVLPDATIIPALNGVLTYKTHGQDMVLYATTAGAASGKVRLVLREGTKDYTLREVDAVPEGQKYLLDLASYDGDWFVVAGSTAEQKAYTYKNPLETLKSKNKTPLLPITILQTGQASFVSFSATARFIALQGGSNFAVYDAEYDRSYAYSLTSTPLDANYEAQWMDGHRLLARSQDKLVIFDYDGINAQYLMPMLPDSLPFFDRDYKRLYTLSPSIQTANQFALSKTNLKVVAPGQEP